MRELFGWRLAGKVAPIIEGVYPLVDAAAVLQRVHGRGSAGKLILKP
jgi:NADPH2:quinone reductase